ncbi:Vacuolar protein sorting 11 [Carabus blaptoides fortunei]
MAFYEWKRFNFFDLKEDVDDGKIAALFKDTDVTAATSGNSQLVFGDSTGQLHIVSRNWTVTTFRGYEIRVILAQQLRQSSFLVTIGEDEPGINPVLKVWDTSRLDRQGSPVCVRITRTIPQNRPVEACCLCVHDGLQLLAVGFVDGSLILYRGDITRDRSTRQKVLRDGTASITGLSFKSTANSTLLFVSTSSSVFIYNITNKDKEQKIPLDILGCSPKCSVIAESLQDGHFMVGRNEAVYCYTTDGRGPCYAVDGEKVMMEWFRSYLVIISKSASRAASATTPTGTHLITVLDLQNKFIVFSSLIQEVKAVLSEWGAFYILGGDNEIYHLDEKDLQSKLTLLFKKNFYDISIRIAKSQQYDSDGLIDIFRQYGDHLYHKGDPAGAVEQYIKTIGKLEASYVIRKFLDSQYITMLIRYLQALHKQGHASEDHTTLLLNCYKKEDKTEELKEFIMTKDRELDFDVEIAIKVCRQVSIEDALNLAKKHGKHDWYLKIQIEDNKKYAEGLEYISNLEFDEAELYMKKYGNVLIKNVPGESTQFLKKLCTDYRPENEPLISETMLDGSIHVTQKADPENYIHLFLNNSARLVEFLEYLVTDGQALSTGVYDTLLEHYLHVWGSLEQGAERNRYEQRVLKLLQNPEIKYDKHQALVVCHMHKFSLGVLHLYEEQKQYQRILGYHLARRDSASVLVCCRRFGHQEPTLWLQALWACVRDSSSSENNAISSLELTQLLPEVLSVVAKERLLSPMLVVDALVILASAS